jgi:hypothetical protein
MPAAAAGFEFEGVKYEFHSLMLAEARASQRATKMTVVEWEAALNVFDAEAVTALIWIARRRTGEPNLRFEDVDGDLSTFAPIADPDSEAADGEGEETTEGKDPAGPEPDGTSGTPSAEG